MMSLSFLRFAAVAALSLCLAGCGRTEAYRYKVTLAVNTPEGVKRGSSVVEVLFYNVSIPERGTMHKLRGEALYLDLGPGARPLIALLTSQLHPEYGTTVIAGRRVLKQRWSRDAGPDIAFFLRLYGEAPSDDFLAGVSRLARMRGPRRITPADLPDLVAFADINDPKSVIEVYPNDLQATLGPNITWNEITLESTDEPVTKGIELKLTWLPAYFEGNLRLDGSTYGANKELANILNWSDFDQSGDLRRSN
jgi:hypothetical protein